MAEVEMEIKDKGLPIHKDATLKIRPRIFLEGNFFVDLSPGTPQAPTIDDGDTIPSTQTASPVQLDQVLTALQSDTREDLKTLLDEYGRALTATRRPDATGPRRRTRTVDAGETAAESLNDTYDDAGPALRGAAIVNEAFLGDRAARPLAAASPACRRSPPRSAATRRVLQDFVANFNPTLAIFADEKENVSATIRELPATLAATPTARSRRSTARSRRRARSPARSCPASARRAPTIEAARPVDRAGAPAAGSRAELQGLAKELRPTDARPRGRHRRGDRAASRSRTCSPSAWTDVILPTGDIKIRETGNRAQFDTGVENYKEFWYTMAALAGEGQNFDGNGQYVRFQPGGGTQTLSTGRVERTGSATQFFNLASPAARRAPGVPRQAPAVPPGRAVPHAEAARPQLRAHRPARRRRARRPARRPTTARARGPTHAAAAAPRPAAAPGPVAGAAGTVTGALPPVAPRRASASLAGELVEPPQPVPHGAAEAGARPREGGDAMKRAIRKHLRRLRRDHRAVRDRGRRRRLHPRPTSASTCRRGCRCSAPTSSSSRASSRRRSRSRRARARRSRSPASTSARSRKVELVDGPRARDDEDPPAVRRADPQGRDAAAAPEDRPRGHGRSRCRRARARAPRVPEGWTVPVQNTLPDVKFDEILASLDRDTRDYLRLLVNGAGGGLRGAGDDLAATFKRFEPGARELRRITDRARGPPRRTSGARSTTCGCSSRRSARRTTQLAQLIDSSNAVFRSFAAQDRNLRSALQQLPPTLRQTNARRSTRSTELARVLGPALEDLRPTARALGPTLRQMRPFLRETTPIIRDQLRPFARDVQPVVKRAAPGRAGPVEAHARPRRRRSASSTTSSTSSPTTRPAPARRATSSGPSWVEPPRRARLQHAGRARPDPPRHDPRLLLDRPRARHDHRRRPAPRPDHAALRRAAELAGLPAVRAGRRRRAVDAGPGSAGTRATRAARRREAARCRSRPRPSAACS